MTDKRVPITDVPDNLEQFWQEKYHEKFEDFRNIAITFSSNPELDTQTKNGVVSFPIADPLVFKATQTLLAYNPNSIPAPDKTIALQALNTLIKFKEEGPSFIYFDRSKSSFYNIVTLTPPVDGKAFSKLDIVYQAVINHAIAMEIDKAVTIDSGAFWSDEKINAKREEIANNNPLLTSLVQNQNNLADKFDGIAPAAGTVLGTPTSDQTKSK